MQRFNRIICVAIILTFVLCAFSGCEKAFDALGVYGASYSSYQDNPGAAVEEQRSGGYIMTTALSLLVALLLIILFVVKRNDRIRLADLVYKRTAELEKAEHMTSTLNKMSVLFLSQDNKTHEEKLSSGIRLIADLINLDRVSVWRNTDTPEGVITSQIYRWWSALIYCNNHPHRIHLLSRLPSGGLS